MKRKGKSYINVRGSGVIHVKARNREEAIAKAKAELERMMKEKYPSFERINLLDRWMGMVGFERPTEGTASSEVNLRWQNKRGGKWIQTQG